MTIGILPNLLKGKGSTAQFSRKPVGAGPYKLTKWDEGQSITLKKFDGYYAGKPHIRKIVFKIVEDKAMPDCCKLKSVISIWHRLH